MSEGSRERGFTLPEVIMAVTILGIIGVTIGAIVTTAFSSTAGMRERYDASRAAKQASAYWTPDVQSAESVNPDGIICGSGGRDLVTFGSTEFPSVTATRSPSEGGGTPRLTTWWLDDADPARVVRRTCLRSAPAVAIDTVSITSRVPPAAGDRVMVECSEDGTTFRPCAVDDTAAVVVRFSAAVLDSPSRHVEPFEFHTDATREVR